MTQQEKLDFFIKKNSKFTLRLETYRQDKKVLNLIHFTFDPRERSQEFFKKLLDGSLCQKVNDGYYDTYLYDDELGQTVVPYGDCLSYSDDVTAVCNKCIFDDSGDDLACLVCDKSLPTCRIGICTMSDKMTVPDLSGRTYPYSYDSVMGDDALFLIPILTEV
jgi:hypothetical protein